MGILVMILSAIFLLVQIGPYFVSDKALSPEGDIAVTVSIVGVIAGMYFFAGPLPALIAMIPVAVGGCVGCNEGEEEKEEEEEDLGEPPAPPPIPGHIIP